MNSGCPVQVDFGVADYTLTKRIGCRTGTFTLPVVDPIANTSPYTVTLPSGVLVSSSIDPLVFDALGRTTTTGGAVVDATITIGGRTLESVGQTGLVRVP